MYTKHQNNEETFANKPTNKIKYLRLYEDLGQELRRRQKNLILFLAFTFCTLEKIRGKTLQSSSVHVWSRDRGLVSDRLRCVLEDMSKKSPDG